MKNKILHLMLFALAVVGLPSCEKDTTAGKTGITYYPTFEILGNVISVVEKGATYVDDGCYVELNGEDVTDQARTSSNVNTDKTGLYSVVYGMTNPDGFSASVSRTVIVYDPTSSSMVSGVYTVLPESNRDGAASPEYAKGNTLIIYQEEPGVFYISDLFGGYYDIGRGYGSRYATAGKLNLSGTSISLLESATTPWGDAFDSFSGTYDEASKTWICLGMYGGYNFNLIIEKN